MSFSPASISVWQDVDVLILGSSCAAVSAALAAHASGSRVAVLADETYLGQDLAGTFQLWAEPSDDPLVAAAFASCTEHPARPAALKRHLEHALIRAGIPFLYSVRPVGLLRDEAGQFRGAVVAARTSLFAVTCREIVDATPFGLAVRLAGAKLEPRPDPASPLRWRILAERAPAHWPGVTRPLLPSYRQILRDGEKEYAAFELEIARSELGADARSLEHTARSLLVDEAVWVTADHLLDTGEFFLPSPNTPVALADLSESQLQLPGGIWCANTLLPVSEPADFLRPGKMSALGRRVGTCAAIASRSKPAQTGPLHFQADGSQGGPFSFTTPFLREACGVREIGRMEFPEWEDFDVVVAGGGTAGAPAAIAAARSGAKTLCLETAHGLGGVGTLGLISSYWFGNKCGFTAELNELVSAVDAQSRAKNGNVWHPGVKSAIYHRLLCEAGGTGWMGSFLFGVRMNGNRPDAVLVSTPHGCGFVKAKSFVDATGNADLAAAAGARCRLMDQRHVAVQGTGISPRVYPSVGHQNSDHTFIEENDPVGITCAHVQAREKYPNDFETTAFINSRERRQIHGELEVSPLDILSGRTYPDTVFTARSNFDTHGFIIHPVFMVVPPDHRPLEAHVPLRCMIPQGVEGILVTGLGMSAHRDALPVIRMQADVQNQGYVAGLLAAQTAQSGEDLRAIDVRAFQRRLAELGIISPATAEHSDSFPLDQAAVSAAVHGQLDQAKDVAILFAHPEACRSELRQVMAESPDPSLRRRAALILGLMGDQEAGSYLREIVAREKWDEGWNYRGMGQFGSSMSPLDALIIALGRSRDPEADAQLAKLASQLGPEAEFSHCRALALAAANLRSPELANTLARLLELPGFCGHAFVRLETMLADSDGEPTSTSSRNLALRELHVARGLFLAGDPNGRGRKILETYALDLRGHFARHAAAVLQEGRNGTAMVDLA